MIAPKTCSSDGVVSELGICSTLLLGVTELSCCAAPVGSDNRCPLGNIRRATFFFFFLLPSLFPRLECVTAWLTEKGFFGNVLFSRWFRRSSHRCFSRCACRLSSLVEAPVFVLWKKWENLEVVLRHLTNNVSTKWNPSPSSQRETVSFSWCGQFSPHPYS